MTDLVDSCERKHEWNDNNWPGKADEISVSYCVIYPAMGNINHYHYLYHNSMNEFIALHLYTLNLSNLLLKNNWQFWPPRALGPCALHTAHTLLVCYWLKKKRNLIMI